MNPQDFHAFSISEDKRNYIYPFLSRRKVNNYNNLPGQEHAFAVMEGKMTEGLV